MSHPPGQQGVWLGWRAELRSVAGTNQLAETAGLLWIFFLISCIN